MPARYGQLQECWPQGTRNNKKDAKAASGMEDVWYRCVWGLQKGCIAQLQQDT
jgi:hypothetical protein